MFQREEMVVYGIQGVCKITDISCRAVGGKQMEYYVLQPISQPDARFYVPVQNPAAVAKMRKLLSREALESILHSTQDWDDSWNPNESQRKESYRAWIAQADCARLLRALQCLYHHKQEQLAAGRKFHQCDENFMKDAERLVRGEVSYVLDIPLSSVDAFLQENLKNRQA